MPDEYLSDDPHYEEELVTEGSYFNFYTAHILYIF